MPRACLEFDETYERMVPICEAALADSGASDQQRIEILENLGTALLNLGRADEAEQRYQELLGINATAAAGLNGLGWVHRDREEYDAALEMFRAAAERQPSAEALAGQGANADLVRTRQFRRRHAVDRNSFGNQPRNTVGRCARKAGACFVKRIMRKPRLRFRQRWPWIRTTQTRFMGWRGCWESWIGMTTRLR